MPSIAIPTKQSHAFVVHRFSELVGYLLDRKATSALPALTALPKFENPNDLAIPVLDPSSRTLRLGEILEQRGIVSDEDLHLALAEKLKLPFVYLADFDIDSQALSYLPEELARQYRLLPIALLDGKRIVVAMDDPTDNDAIQTLVFVTGKPIEVVIAARGDILAAIDRYYRNDISESSTQSINALFESESPSVQELERQLAERLSQQKPVVRFVNHLLKSGIRRRASDIHIRPTEEGANLIFRIDGTLVDISCFNKITARGVISRLKILGGMNIAIKRLPQDGQSRIICDGSTVDLRLSIMPTVEGESVAIRILNKQANLKNLDDIGFRPRELNLCRELIQRSSGMILVTGPTGGGKSTTLYCMLQEIIQQNVSIITVEDPVEYRVPGIEQVQVNTAAGLTFARVLRNVLRHDPDVVMIGEIRDRETAQIAVESALTGHLVLSTLHTNSAAATVTRLLEMGIEPYLINATLLGVVNQRLVRLNCPDCLVEEPPQEALHRSLGLSAAETFYHGGGCSHCNDLGFHGRMAVYEFLQVTPLLRQCILQAVDTDKLWAQAIQDGMRPLTQNALDAARQRLIPLSEVYRVRME